MLSLTEVFRAKLGWLVGNMYSRVATEDWVPRYDTEDEFNKRIDRLLDEACDLWVEDRAMKGARGSATGEVLKGGREAARKHISSTVVPKRRDVILDCVAAALRDTGIVTHAKEIERICRQIGNDPSFAANTKQ